VRTHLVIAAGTQPQNVRRAIERFRVTAPQSVVITKVDETDTLSPLLSALRGARGPAVSYLGVGQRVPEDLIRATGAILAGCVLGESAGAVRISA
ncbi:MAG: flagellar biosynthesis protein FlhF, partial [Acidobacteria bacterium]|nr:flagellar biosynthesis protein FlhF [Acidobacteriota bacterium]